MPTMANVVVKNAANVDVTFAAVASSSGDKSPAMWNVAASSLVRANRQKAEVEFHDNGNGSSRVGVMTVAVPYLQTVDGVERIVAYQNFKLVSSTPKIIPDSNVNDGAVIALNFFGAALIKSAAAEGISPRA